MDRTIQQRLLRSWPQQLLAFCISLLCLTALSSAAADTNDVALSVWANEAIVSAYTFNDTNLLQRQKDIAKYFTAQAWIAFSKAITTAKLKESVEQNHYKVSAVALLPPTIKQLNPKGEWQATMPLMVLYKNPEYQQKQTLNVVITFILTKPGIGIRGFAISSFNSTVKTPACRCENRYGTKTIV
jgi:hypothetical protein